MARKMAQLWVVAYDIADQRQRTRLHKLLRGFGEAVQKSVFLCPLDGRRKTRLVTVLQREPLAPGDRLDLFQIQAAQALGADRLVAAANPEPVVIVE